MNILNTVAVIITTCMCLQTVECNIESRHVQEYMCVHTLQTLQSN